MSALKSPSAFLHGRLVDDGNGMTLRDWFAGQVTEQCIRNALDNTGSWDEHNVAYHAYLLADAMLAARAEKHPAGLETEQAAPGTGEKLLTIAREFIDKHHVSCAEATGEDSVYENAPLLVEALAGVVGYYSYPDDAA